jgi:RHS repeat-associated protein
VGNNSTTDSHVPVQVSGLSGITAIAAGTSHLLALKSDGTVWAWGYNSNGQVGNNATTDVLVPVQVQGLSGAVGISGGYTHSMAVRSDGTVWAWGYNGYGQLGNNTVTDAHVATQVPGLAGVTSVSAGFFHTLALKADGTVSAWGYNAYGGLGNNSTTDSHVPVAVPGLTTVATVAAGSYHSYVLNHDGTVWDFGLNNYGQLGNGTTTDSHVPIAIGLANATGLAAGYIHVLVPRADNTLTAWGYNAYGGVGNGTTVDAHLPVTVTGFNRGGSFLNRGTSAKATYAYNGDGLRTSNTVAGATKAMAWDVAEGVPALLSDGTNTYVYGPGGLPIEQVDGAGNVLYFQHDQLGSTRLLSNASGAVVATFTYDAFGKLTASTGSVTTPLGYAGQYTDAETGFQYLQARYYDPATGQFVSRDPLVALTGSAYGYVGGNPLNATDPLGLWCAVHNSNGGCLGSSVVKAVQEPIAVVGVLASHVSAIAQTVAVACAVAGQLECTAFAESVSVATGALSTVATLETTAYACANSPTSSACITGGAVTLLSAASTIVGIRLGEGVLPTLGRGVLTDANAAVNTATLRSRLLSADRGQAGCPK